MAKYLLILHETPGTFAHAGPEEIQKIIEDYSAWARNLAEQERLGPSQKLMDEGGKHIRPGTDGSPLVTDGPYSESTEIIGGIFTITAESYEEAAEISSASPHIKYGGWIEVRQIHELPEN